MIMDKKNLTIEETFALAVQNQQKNLNYHLVTSVKYVVKIKLFWQYHVTELLDQMGVWEVFHQ